MAANDQLHEGMRELAEQAVSVAKGNYGYDLNFTVESVEQVEELLGDMQKLVNSWRYRFVQTKKRAEIAQKTSLIYGAYIGEVMLCTWGGKWVVPDEGPFRGVPTVILDNGLTTSPSSRVYKRIVEGPFNSVLSYVRAIPAIAQQSSKASAQDQSGAT